MTRWHPPKDYSPLASFGFHAKLRRRRKDFSGLELRGIYAADKEIADANFSNSTFDGCQLARVTFDRCDFDGARIKGMVAEATAFRSCSFERTAMDFADLRMVDFQSCKLANTSFRHAQMESVSVTDCYVARSSFILARLDGVRFTTSHLAEIGFERASFIDCDVGVFTQQITPHLMRGASFDWKTVGKSVLSVKLLQLLRASGVPEIMAMYMVHAAKTLDPSLLFKLMRSTFISYGSPDARFARALRDRLQANGVRTFFFETDAVPGERIHRVMRQGVNDHDRVVLICSAASLNRPGVRNEIEETLAREARDGGASYLIPVVLDDFLFEWNDPLAVTIRDRVVADFRKPDRKIGDALEVNLLDIAFEEGLVRLLDALRIS